MDNNNVDKNKKAECHKKIAQFLKKAAELHEKAANESNCDKAAAYTFEAFGYICEAKCHIKKMAKNCAGITCTEDKDNEARPQFECQIIFYLLFRSC